MSDVVEAEAPAEDDAVPELPIQPLFGKWDLSEVEVEDPTLRKYINLNAFQVPHTGGRHARTRFAKHHPQGVFQNDWTAALLEAEGPAGEIP